MKLKSICVASFITALLVSSQAFAAIKIHTNPSIAYNGAANDNDYVGIIVAAEFTPASDNQGVEMLILTKADPKNQNSPIDSATFRFDKSELPMGYVLANSVGKKVVVRIPSNQDEVPMVSIVTDEFYYGDNQQNPAKK